MESGLGAVSLIGFGIGSRPETYFDALRALEDAGFEVLDSYTGRESLSFVLETSCVHEGMRTLHATFVETTHNPQGLSDRTGAGSGREIFPVFLGLAD
jgi:aspartokinase